MVNAIILGGSRGIGKAISDSLNSINIEVFAASKNDIDTWKIDWSSVAINNLKARDASSDNHFVAMAHEYINTVDSAKANESAKKELRSLIKDDEREVFCDLLAVRRDKRGACRIVVNKEA